PPSHRSLVSYDPVVHLWLPRPPASTLFPYTTLFRSYRKAFSEHVLPALEDFAPELVFVSAGFDAHAGDPLAHLKLEDDDYTWLTDRKSTRLNSSHVSISYAVFCLKKKNKRVAYANSP